MNNKANLNYLQKRPTDAACSGTCVCVMCVQFLQTTRHSSVQLLLLLLRYMMRLHEFTPLSFGLFFSFFTFEYECSFLLVRFASFSALLTRKKRRNNNVCKTSF